MSGPPPTQDEILAKLKKAAPQLRAKAEDVEARYPSMAWHSIRDAGNVHRHSCDRTVPGFVWKTAQSDLNVPAAMVQAEIAASAVAKETGEQSAP